MGNYLVTGAAGFIGARTSELLIKDGHTVTGIDNLNEAYDPRMKNYRLQRLQSMDGFTFHKLDISDKSIIDHFTGQKFDGIINLAARAGVRASVDNPVGVRGKQRNGHSQHAGDLPPDRDAESSLSPPLPAFTDPILPIRRPKRPPAASRCSPTRPAKREPRRCAMPTITCTGST